MTIHRVEPMPTVLDRRTVRAPASSLGNAQSAAEQAARSTTNIALWNAYLPRDCVDSMVAMGWDVTA